MRPGGGGLRLWRYYLLSDKDKNRSESSGGAARRVVIKGGKNSEIRPVRDGASETGSENTIKSIGKTRLLQR